MSDGAHDHPQYSSKDHSHPPHEHAELAAAISRLGQRVAALENAPAPTPAPPPAPAPEPPQDGVGPTVLAASSLRNVPVPELRNSPHVDVFTPGRAGDHPWGIGGVQVGHVSHGYTAADAAHYPYESTASGWKIPYEHHMNKSMPIKLARPVREAWACKKMALHDDWRWGRTTKVGGFISPDGRSDFSMRFCVWDWHRRGDTHPGLYYYHIDQKESWGDDQNSRFDLQPGGTYDVVIGCGLNDPGKANGWGRLFIKRSDSDTWHTAADVQGLRWPNSAIISHYYLGHMYGGPYTVWAPEDGFPGPWHMTLSDFAVAEKREDLLPFAR
jgi:hypothetical protein